VSVVPRSFAFLLCTAFLSALASGCLCLCLPCLALLCFCLCRGFSPLLCSALGWARVPQCSAGKGRKGDKRGTHRQWAARRWGCVDPRVSVCSLLPPPVCLSVCLSVCLFGPLLLPSVAVAALLHPQSNAFESTHLFRKQHVARRSVCAPLAAVRTRCFYQRRCLCRPAWRAAEAVWSLCVAGLSLFLCCSHCSLCIFVLSLFLLLVCSVLFFRVSQPSLM
jgi:hypothetical protein